MKMEQKDYNVIKNSFSENIETIKSHYIYLQELLEKGQGNIQNIENRLSWNVYRGIISQDFRNMITFKRDYNDSHILTGIKKALKELGVI